MNYFSKQPVWFPKDYNRLEFEGLPSEILRVQPTDGRSPDAYFIELCGDEEGDKLGDGATITINLKAHDWLSKYRALKDLLFGQLGKFFRIFKNFLEYIFSPRRTLFCQP